MLLLPADMRACLAHFAPLFSRRTWRHVPLLVVGALLAPGRRMVTTALRAVGLAHTPTFQTYHRLLNRAKWTSLDASRILLRLLVTTFAPQGPLVLGIDETIERRRSQKIAATGIYRDRYLSRPGALQPQPLRQSQWAPLGLPDGACAHPLGRTRVGAALSHRARSL
jgi:hypothetical protein